MDRNRRHRRFLDEPNMSDKTLLVSVEDLVNTAFGAVDQNIVNFKVIQTVLHILARQMRILEQEVEIKFDELGIGQEPSEAYEWYDQYSTSPSAASKEEVAGKEGRYDKGRGKEGRDDKGRGIEERYDKGRGIEERYDKGRGIEGRDDKGRGIEERYDKDRGREERYDKDRGREERYDKDRGKEGAHDTQGDKMSWKDRDDRGGSKESKEDRGRPKEKGRLSTGGPRDKESPAKDKSGSKDRGGERVRKEKDKGKKGERGADRDDDGGQDRSRDRGGERGKERGAEGRKGTPESGRYAPDSRGRSTGREGSLTSITVTETTRKGGKGGQDKILVVEKGPASYPGGRVARVGSIEVVTASQFALLEKAVGQLEKVAGPLPMPALPDNERLRQDLAKGRASLSETMQAMQMNARVQAAEQGLTRMAELLTQLAATGALPEDMVDRIEEMRSELDQGARAVADVGTGPGGAGIGHRGAGMGPRGTSMRQGGVGSETGGAGTWLGSVGVPGSTVLLGHPVSTLTSTPSRSEPMKRGEAPYATTSRGSVPILGKTTEPSRSAAPPPKLTAAVTHSEMEDVLQIMKDELMEKISTMTARATHSADVASNTSKAVADKVEIALNIDSRISKLLAQVTDYAEQLSGFDSGVSTQMASFQEQMAQMRTDLSGGIEMLEQATNNAETAAVLDLTERYEGLVIELDSTLHRHQSLTTLQKQLSDEMRSLVECVEMLREQKADRDEVVDGLRDKADITRLAGLLHEEDFEHARSDLETRLAKCHEKFKRQDGVWMEALRDLTSTTERKAEIVQLLSIKDNATQELKNIQETLHQLYILLGEPKAAILMRQLAKDAVCGSCLSPALMAPTDANYGKPFPLPELRPPPLGEERPCLTDLKPLPPPDTRTHVCRRWVGGSHTLMADNVTWEKARVTHRQTIPTKRFTGYGTDGRLYMLEEELQPCLECNKLDPDEPEASTPQPTPIGGGGDHAGASPTPAEKEVDEKETGNI